MISIIDWEILQLTSIYNYVISNYITGFILTCSLIGLSVSIFAKIMGKDRD